MASLTTLRSRNFQIEFHSHAEAILTYDFPQASAELWDVLDAITIPIEEIIAGGGGEAKGTQRLRKALTKLGWLKTTFVVGKTINGVEREAVSHIVDHSVKFSGGSMKGDRTIERNYLQQWRLLILEYEAVKTRQSGAFRTVREFYHYHGTCSQTFRKYYNRYLASGSAGDLLPRRRGPKCRQRSEAEIEQAREAVFKVLHSPPSDFGFNRTTWKRDELQQALKMTGMVLSKRNIRSIIKTAGYRWLKAKKVLTSKDPEYRTKLDALKSILQGLKRDEGFFSIDEFGPFAVLERGGRKLIAPGQRAAVPQWQKSKGAIIITAALELSSNQVTHLYSETKNTIEVIKLLNLLLERNRHLSRLYLSWDAASWHMSKKKLTERIASNNVMAFVTGSTWVETVPLPAGAQFLNVIESVFSGLARAVIHNSNYSSVEEAKAAIDRYFSERNEHFCAHPKRAGNKLWSKERAAAAFSESSNYKDPRYG